MPEPDVADGRLDLPAANRERLAPRRSNCDWNWFRLSCLKAGGRTEAPGLEVGGAGMRQSSSRGNQRIRTTGFHSQSTNLLNILSTHRLVTTKRKFPPTFQNDGSLILISDED